jgi:hypothetical protein
MASSPIHVNRSICLHLEKAGRQAPNDALPLMPAWPLRPTGSLVFETCAGSLLDLLDPAQYRSPNRRVTSWDMDILGSAYAHQVVNQGRSLVAVMC